MSLYYEYRYNIGMSLTTQVTIDFLKNIPIKFPATQQSFIHLCNYMPFLNETKERRKNEKELIEFIDKQIERIKSHEWVKVIEGEKNAKTR